MIELRDLTRIYDGVAAVDHVSLTVERGQIATLVGASGSGKTTLLRMINRLVEPSSGQVQIEGRDTASMPVHQLRRRIGYAIQGVGLFPHQSVAENIATVPRLLGWSNAQILDRVDELLSLFQLDPATFRDRRPGQLSGGQTQRVGVARALAARPDLLLMDEPFGALDSVIRAKAQSDLRDIQSRLGTTMILVTHDIEEAVRLGDRIAVMDRGKVLQYDTPAQVLAHPATPFVRDLIGPSERVYRLLSLTTVAEIAIAGDAYGPAIPRDLTLREALAEIMRSGRDALPLEGGGIVTLAALRARSAR
ncbi:ABC transporter ATP-binding protein [Paracoccus aestuariivivens]|uniref:ATP-binding cassette domain-containing protein n=1 Tax=Paracoccus aestuariivivens TaxID=1820333 RepID=A0A6L6JDH5_9RHOB|nr:ABC transporter ATP-binding protein [Paracoccus aestuariivivens]MTH79265.1 ATP-binding cassette domain-containing protein [Paracoccus aestuariivivens]